MNASCYANALSNGTRIERSHGEVIVMTSIARRLDSGTYQPHRAAPIGARSVPERTVFTVAPLSVRLTAFALQCALGAVAGFVLGLCFTVSP